MIASMGKQKPQKPDPDPGKPPPLFVRIDRPLHEAIQAFIAAQEVPPDRTAVVVTALQQFLARHGLWPAAKPGKPS